MKRLRSLILFSAALMLIGQGLTANEINPDDKIPLDPKVRYGKLDNGLTYYVLENQEPKDRASFYIVQNVGAILENDEQNGLAHFLEHMAFNGTKNYPDKGILNYLEQYGVAFGRNINAYTNVDETVYNLSDVPTTNENLVDSALLVLHDWSNYLTLDGEEIDKERGVIREEWRTRRSGRMRVYLESRKYIYKGSKYAERDVIGDLDVINNFDHQVIRDFYHDWYRTDLQAIIVVGDIDAEKIENKIKDMFAHIPAVENAKERKYFDIPGNKEPIIGIVKDKEAGSVSMNLYIKHDATPFDEKGKEYYRSIVMNELYGSMFGNRIQELLQKGEPPVINAYAYYYNMERKMDVYNLGMTLKEDNILGGMSVIFNENERVKRFGFVESELERAKTEYFSQIEAKYKDRNKIGNDRLVRELQNNYLTNEPAPGIEWEYEVAKQILPTISLEEINKLGKAWNTKENIVLTLALPEKEGLEAPSESEILTTFKASYFAELKPYEDVVIDQPLVAEMPSGTIAKENIIDALGATEYTLANGAKVIVKKTDFKENEILFNAFSTGGSSLVADADVPSAMMLGDFMGSFGIGEFDMTSLQKLLTGKVVRVQPVLTDLSEEFRGNSSVQDFETMLQLIYLYFENPRFDEDAFNALKSRYAAFVKNMGADVNKAFSDSISMTVTNHHPRTHLLSEEMINNLDFNKMKEIYSDRFKDASDFIFVFVGNVDPAESKELIAKYIGGIKDIDREDNWKDNNVDYPAKDTKNAFNIEMQVPKTSIYINLHGDAKYNAKSKIYMGMLSDLLDKRYTEVIREQEGGTYGVRVMENIDKYPTEEFALQIVFDTDPEKSEKLKNIVFAEIDKIQTEINDVDFNEVIKNYQKVREENLRKNNYWSNAIKQYVKYNENVVAEENYEKIVNSVTKDDLMKYAKAHFGNAKKVEVIMSPAN